MPLLACQITIWLSMAVAGGFSERPTYGPNIAGDFAMFMGAAEVVRHGGSPYNHQLLYNTYVPMLTRLHLQAALDARVMRVGNPPFMFLAMQPLTAVPFVTIARVWCIVMYLFAVVGFLALLAFFGWRARVLPLLLCSLMPLVVLGAVYGNVGSVVLASLGVGLALSRRFPFIAGTVLALSWVKPHVALPFVALVCLFHVANRRRVLAGLVVASSLFFLVAAAAMGPAIIGSWLGSFTGYRQDISAQANLASLSGLYSGWAPYEIRTVAQGFLLALALGLTVFTAWRWRGVRTVPFSATAWLWFVWFLALPYVHYPDEIILAVPLLALLGRTGSSGTLRDSVAVAYVMFLSTGLLVMFPHMISLLCVIVIMLLVYAAVAARQRSSRTGAMLPA